MIMRIDYKLRSRFIPTPNGKPYVEAKNLSAEELETLRKANDQYKALMGEILVEIRE